MCVWFNQFTQIQWLNSWKPMTHTSIKVVDQINFNDTGENIFSRRGEAYSY